MKESTIERRPPPGYISPFLMLTSLQKVSSSKNVSVQHVPYKMYRPGHPTPAASPPPRPCGRRRQPLPAAPLPPPSSGSEPEIRPAVLRQPPP